MEKHFKNSLMKVYITIVCIVGLVLTVSFLVFYGMAEKSYIKSAEDAIQSLFLNEQKALAEFDQSINNLFSMITSNESVKGYLSASELSEYMSRRLKVEQLVGSMQKVNIGTKSIVLYNKNGTMVGMMGNAFFQEEEREMGAEYGGYSNCLASTDGSRQTFFHVEHPVYHVEGSTWSKIGSIGILFDTSKLQEIVDLLSVNNGGYAAVLDREKTPLVASGEFLDLGQIQRDEKSEDSYLIYRYILPSNGWELINIIPRSTFMGYPADIQKITLFTYGIILGVLVLLCFLIYKQIISPIRRQMEFVVGYTRDTKQRIEVVENNEFGELADKINQMLDELETLNRQVIEGERKLLQAEYAKKQTEMIAYKSQINPHFMYNTLESIRGMALYKNEKEIAKLTGSLSQLFRYNVKGKELVTIGEVVKNLREYAQIIDYRFMGKFEANIILQQDTLLLRYIPKMLIQPLLENAVLHGLEPTTKKGTATVVFSEKADGGVEIQVTDDGCGIPEEKLLEIRKQISGFEEAENDGMTFTGIGISNVYRRLKLFYGKEASLDIQSEVGRGTRITMYLPAEMVA